MYIFGGGFDGREWIGNSGLAGNDMMERVWKEKIGFWDVWGVVRWGSSNGERGCDEEFGLILIFLLKSVFMWDYMFFMNSNFHFCFIKC